MPKEISAGLLMFAKSNNGIKYFLVHPGGPFFAKKDEGYWSIPKGLPEDSDKSLLDTAQREFLEETGIIPGGNFIELGTVIQKNGKEVHSWAFECGSDDPVEITCNLFEMEWPPRSGKRASFPEVDRGEFFSSDEARKKINSAQVSFIERLEKILEEN